MMTGEMARIYLKNGESKTGLLLNDVEDPNTFDEGVKFIPHHKISDWYDSFDVTCICTMEPEAVEGIDVLMK